MNLAVTCPTEGKGEGILIGRRPYYFCDLFDETENQGLRGDLGPRFIGARKMLCDPEPDKLSFT